MEEGLDTASGVCTPDTVAPPAPEVVESPEERDGRKSSAIEAEEDRDSSLILCERRKKFLCCFQSLLLFPQLDSVPHNRSWRPCDHGSEVYIHLDSVFKKERERKKRDCLVLLPSPSTLCPVVLKRTRHSRQRGTRKEETRRKKDV